MSESKVASLLLSLEFWTQVYNRRFDDRDKPGMKSAAEKIRQRALLLVQEARKEGYDASSKP